MLSFLRQYFGFTPNEIKVVLVLTATFLTGVAIRWYRSSWEGPPAQFGYAREDSIFLERSRRLFESDSSGAGDNQHKTGKKQSTKKTQLLPHSIDLNEADSDKLQLLPGIGKAYAERVISYRKIHGPFTSVDDLDHVKGIGKKTIERLRPYVFVRSTDSISVKPP
jgi:competence ComEA-like helix-hairpin-helix protein